MCGGEVPSEYEHDQLKARLDWRGDLGELDIKQDKIDKIDHEAMYSDAEDDPLGDPPDLEESDSVNTSVYDRLEATQASTAISTDTEVAGDMLNLTMGQPELPAPQDTHESADDFNQDDNPLEDMFQVPTEAPVFRVPLPAKPRLDPRALMAEAKLKSGWRTLPPPPSLRRHIDDPDSDTRNVVLRALQTPTVTDTQVEVANPQNTNPLDLEWDVNRDKALQVMQERRRRESHSSSAGSHSSSGKRHRSGSQSRNETDTKKGRQTPTEDWTSLGPVATGQMRTLDWSQNILEPRKPGWKPAAGDAPATPQHTVKSVVKATGKSTPEPAAGAKAKPWVKPASELTSRGVGHGQVIAEKLQQIANMGPAATSQFTRDERDRKKKPESRKVNFPTPEEREACRHREKHKDWVVNHKDESIGERYHSIKRQTHRYGLEIQSLRFFQLDNHVNLACQVLAITDWVEEFNELSHNPIPEVPEALLAPYSGSKTAQGQFLLPPSSEEPGITDVRTRSQAVWIYLCAILQYFEDDMATQEGALYGGKTRKPSALVLYIMEHVNPGLLEPYRVHWHNIVGKTPWLAFRETLNGEELQWFYQELEPEDPSEVEKATKDVYRRAVEDAAQWEGVDRPIPPSRTDEAETRNSPGVQLPDYEDTPDCQTQPAASAPPDRAHKFEPGPDWTKITERRTSPGATEVQPGTTPADSLDKELGKDKVNDVLGDYLQETETESAVKNLLRAHPELAGNEVPEAMDMDEQPPPESVAETQGVGDQPMETEQTAVSPGSFQPELGMPGYNQSLVGSTDQPPSPMMAEENALLDADQDAPGPNQSKAPGASRPDGSPGSKMVLQKRKT